MQISENSILQLNFLNRSGEVVEEARLERVSILLRAAYSFANVRYSSSRAHGDRQASRRRIRPENLDQREQGR